MDRNSKTRQTAAFTAYMERRGMRKTPERFAIYSRLLEMPDHFSIDDIYERMEQGDYHVSRATIYNTVRLLVDAGLLIRHQFGDEGAEYEHITADTTPHHHLVCSVCGHVREITDPEINALLQHKQFRNFTPHYAELSIHGICSRCARRQKQAARREAAPKQNKTKDKTENQ
ncbi:MAG: transcriptional repressor [Clostridium sp.]|nr:transcriptional repressor [Clostridium sp.]